MYGNEIGQKQATEAAYLDRPGHVTVTERLQIQRGQLKQRLALVEEALAALEKEPQVAKTIDAISKLGGII